VRDATEGKWSTAELLREAFDHSFAQAPAVEAASASVLAVRVGGDRYGMRLSDIAGIHRGKVIARVKSSLPELLGMANLRGLIAPVYDLAMLLGHPPAGEPRWLVLSKGRVAIGLAFEALEAHLAVELDRLSSGEGSNARPYLAGAIPHEEGNLAMVRVTSIVDRILARTASSGPAKEG
jgi:purine-binding chemotaxis protein CheW